MGVWAERLLPDQRKLGGGRNLRRTIILLYLYFLVSEFIMDDVFVNLSQWTLCVF